MRFSQCLMLSLAMSLAGATVGGATANAQEGTPAPAMRTPAPAMRLDDVPPTSIQRTLPSAAELRQLRALERQRLRDLRTAANAWAGYDPSRPTLPANPYTQLRNPPYQVRYVVPVWTYPVPPAPSLGWPR